MKCPFCGKDMEKGKLKSRGGMYFLPEGESSPALYTEKEMEKHNAIALPPHWSDIAPEYPDACVCRACGKMIINC